MEKDSKFKASFGFEGKEFDYGIRAKDLFGADTKAQEVAKNRGWLHIATDPVLKKEIPRYDMNAEENKNDDLHQFMDAIKKSNNENKGMKM